MIETKEKGIRLSNSSIKEILIRMKNFVKIINLCEQNMKNFY